MKESHLKEGDNSFRFICTKGAITLLFSAILLSSDAFAQDLRLSFGGNLTRWSTKFDPVNGTFYTEWAPGFCLGLDTRLNLSGPNFLHIGLLANQMNLKDVVEFKAHQLSGEICEMKSTFFAHSFYLSVPLMFQRRYQKVFLSAGVQPSFPLASRSTQVLNGFCEGKEVTTKTNSAINGGRFQLGPIIDVGYVINSDLNANFSFHYGALKMGNNIGQKLRTQLFQLSVGVSYVLNEVDR